jgi:hypothetical protein
MSRAAGDPSPEITPNPIGLLRTKEMARALGIAPRTLRLWRVRHGLPSKKVGRVRYYDPVAVKAKIMGREPDRRRRQKA